jgi:hypothetical protein
MPDPQEKKSYVVIHAHGMDAAQLERELNDVAARGFRFVGVHVMGSIIMESVEFLLDGVEKKAISIREKLT